MMKAVLMQVLCAPETTTQVAWTTWCLTVDFRQAAKLQFVAISA